MDGILSLTELGPGSSDRNFRELVWRKTWGGNWEGIEGVMNPCTKSSADSQLFPAGSQTQAEMDGRDSWEGHVPAEDTAMRGDTG